MLNKKDPLIDAIQQVMQSNQADRDAVKAVNEKFGIQDRRVLPRERQGEWDAAYKTVLSEGVEALDEDWDPEKLKKAKKIEKGAKTIKGKGHIKDFGKLIADRTKNDAVTGLDSASGAKKAMKQLYGKNKGDSGAIKKISEEEKLSSAQKHHMDVDDDNDIDSKDLKMKRMGMEEAKKMKGDDPCWKNYKMVGMKKKGGKPVPNCVPVKEQMADPYAEGQASSITTVKPKIPAPKATSITQDQKNALTNKIKSIKEAKKAAMCEDTLEEGGMKKTMGEFKRGTLHSGSKTGPIVKSRKQAIAIGMNSEEKVNEATAPSMSRADAITQGRQKQQAAAVASSVQKQNAIQRTNVGPGALTGGSLGNNSGSGTTAVSGPASRLSRISSSSVAGDARGGARPGPLPPKSPMAGQGSASPPPKSPMSGQGSASPPPKSPMSGQGSASPPPKSPMSGQGAPGVRSQPGGARPGVVAKNSSTGAQSSTGIQVGGARPDAVAKNSPTAKAPVPTAKPTGGSTGSKVVKPVRKQPTTGTAKPTSGGVPARPARKSSVLGRVGRARRIDKNNDVGPGNS